MLLKIFYLLPSSLCIFLDFNQSFQSSYTHIYISINEKIINDMLTKKSGVIDILCPYRTIAFLGNFCGYVMKNYRCDWSITVP